MAIMDQPERDSSEELEKPPLYQSSSQTYSNSGDENRPGAAASKNGGLFTKLLAFDISLTSCLAVSATKDSPLGFLRPLMKLLEISCHGIPWLTVTILLIFKTTNIHHLEILVNISAALLLDLLVSGILKGLVRRARPVHNKMDMFFTVSVDHYSFPSGHTSRASTMAYFLYEILNFGTTFKIVIWTWAVMVTVSRVMLGRHHVSDVVAGFVIGLCQYLVIAVYWIPPKTCQETVQKIQDMF